MIICLFMSSLSHMDVLASTHIYKVVIEVHIASTQVSPQQRSMSGEDSCDWQLSMSTQDQAESGQPLMEMGDNVWRLLTLGCILWHVKTQGQCELQQTIYSKYALKVLFLGF